MSRKRNPHRDEILELIRTGTATIKEAATVYDVDLSTVYDWVSQEKLKKILDPDQPIKTVADIPKIPETHTIRIEKQLTLQQQLDTIPVGSPVDEARGAVAAMFRALRTAPLTVAGKGKEIAMTLTAAVDAYRQLRDDLREESTVGPGRELSNLDLTTLTRVQIAKLAEIEGLLAGEPKPISAGDEPVIYDDSASFESLEENKPEPFQAGK